MQVAIRFSDDVTDALDEYVDGTLYRSRSHLIEVIVQEWLDRPDDEDETEEDETEEEEAEEEEAEEEEAEEEEAEEEEAEEEE